VFKPSTAKLSKKSHHCIECKTVATSSCYKEKHVAYCAFPVDTNPTGTCNVRSKVKARGGCGKHPYNIGANQRVRQERRDLDPDSKPEEELVAEESFDSKRRQQLRLRPNVFATDFTALTRPFPKNPHIRRSTFLARGLRSVVASQ
jgi:hypothetical protein